MEQLDTISILAGCGYSGSGTNNGIAHFNQPYGMAVLADGTIVVSDSRSNTLRFICPKVDRCNKVLVEKNPVVYTLKSSSMLDPRGVCVAEDGQCIVVCDAGHHKLKLICLSGEIVNVNREKEFEHAMVTPFAGNGRKGHRDGLLRDACFHTPSACCVNSDGCLFVADTGNHCIRRLFYCKDGSLKTSTIAGGKLIKRKDHTGRVPPVTLTMQSGFTDGNGRLSLLKSPCGICCTPSGDLLIADTGNHTIRLLRVLPSTPDGQESEAEYWTVSTIAGHAETGHVDGNCEQARFNQPTSICVGSDGSIFIADKGNMCIRQLTGMVFRSKNNHEIKSEGTVRTIEIDVPAPSRRFIKGFEPSFRMPRGVCALKSKHSWYNNADNRSKTLVGVCDTGNHIIRILSLCQAEKKTANSSLSPQHISRSSKSPVRKHQNEDARPKSTSRNRDNSQIHEKKKIAKRPNSSNIVSTSATSLHQLVDENNNLKKENGRLVALLSKVTTEIEVLAMAQTSSNSL